MRQYAPLTCFCGSSYRRDRSVVSGIQPDEQIPVTEKNSTEKTRPSERKRRLPRGQVTVFPNWCKGCHLCIEFCPVGVLELGEDGRVIVAHGEKCTACRWCERHCPDFAIFVSDLEAGDDGSDKGIEEETE